MKIPLHSPFPSLSEWRLQRQRASTRALVILLVMLALAGGMAAGALPGGGFAIVCLGAALSWVVGVRLAGLELALVALARRHRLAEPAHQQRLVVLAVLAFACEASSAAGIMGLLFAGTVHPRAVLFTLEFGALAVLWNHLMVSRLTSTLALELAPKLPAEEAG